jgi:PAS domain S-box-containing protein
MQNVEEFYSIFMNQGFEGIYKAGLKEPVDITLPVEKQIDLIYEHAFMADCNQALVDMYKTPTVEKFIGTRLIDVHRGKDNPINRATFRNFIENGYKSVSDETVEYNADGELIYFLSNTIGIVENGYLISLWGTAINITERKMIEKALLNEKEKAEKSEWKYKMLFDSMTEGVALNEIIFDDKNEMIDYRIVEVNRAFYNFGDYSDKVVLGNTASSLYGMSEEVINNFWKIHKNSQEPLSSEFKSPIGDRWFYISTSPIINNRFTTTFFDITNSKRADEIMQNAKEAAEKNEAKFRAIFENMLDVYYESRLEGTVTEISPSVENFSKGQYKREDIIGTAIQNYYYNIEDRDILINLILNKGAVSDYEVLIKNRDGSIIHSSISAKVKFDLQGKPEKIIGVLRDISSRKQTERLLKEKTELIEQKNIELTIAKEIAERSEIRFKSITEHATDGITLTDLNGYYVFVNPSFCKMVGYSEDELLKMCVFDLKSPDEKASLFNEVKQKNSAKGNRIPLKCKDGSVIYADIHGKRITLENEELILGIVNDVTEQVITESELLLAKEKAEESDRLKTAFLQNMSHEIRTPMNAIIGFSELLMRNFNNKPKLEKYTSTIIQRSFDLLDIINDILDIAKIESGQLELSPVPCNIKHLFDELSSTFIGLRMRQNKTEVNFKIEIAQALNNVDILVDDVKLKQILINLISNALKFTHKGKIEAGCKLYDDNFLLFYISDTGIGIPTEMQEYIFERFIQVDTSTARLYGGTGLGLAIVKGLTQLLGGKVWLESEFGKGSTFYFTIPNKQIEQTNTTKFQLDYSGIQKFNDKTFLIVEDDEQNSDYLKEILSESGANILQSPTGKEAIAIVKSRPIDLILMDIRLPDMSGYTAICEILNFNPKSKIIAQTAYASNEERQKSLDAGCCEYISKPIIETKLTTIISKIFSHVHFE